MRTPEQLRRLAKELERDADQLEQNDQFRQLAILFNPYSEYEALLEAHGYDINSVTDHNGNRRWPDSPRLALVETAKSIDRQFRGTRFPGSTPLQQAATLILGWTLDCHGRVDETP